MVKYKKLLEEQKQIDEIDTIESVEEFSLKLNDLEEESPELQEDAIRAYVPHLTPNTFIELLNSLSEKAALQEKVIDTLWGKQELRRLCKGVRKEVLQILHDDIVLCQIVKEATQSQVTLFFNQLKRFVRSDANVAPGLHVEQRPSVLI